MGVQILVTDLNGRSRCLHWNDADYDVPVSRVKSALADYLPIELQRLQYRHGRRDLADSDLLPDGAEVVHVFGLLGGKGGFGSLLRGASTKVGQKATSNYTSCRDLSGRRIRHVNDEKALAKWKEEQEKNADKKTNPAEVQKQYKQIKSDVKQREPCKYGEDCKYQFRGCQYLHPKDNRQRKELAQEFAQPDAVTSSLKFDLRASIEQGLRKRKLSSTASSSSKKVAVEDSDSDSEPESAISRPRAVAAISS